MTRLDEIERKAQLLSERRECKVWHFEIADVAALVAVVREAQNVCEVYSRSGEHRPSIECLIDTLAPLLAERDAGSAGGGRDG